MICQPFPLLCLPWPLLSIYSTIQRLVYLHSLKRPKREIFVTELFTLSNPTWDGDLGLKQRIDFKQFQADFHNFVLLATTESSAKIVWRTLSQWQKWFSTRSACGKAGWQIFEILREFLQRFIGKNVSLAKNDKHAHSAWLIFKILRNR